MKRITAILLLSLAFAAIHAEFVTVTRLIP